MAITKERRAELVAEYKDILTRADGLIVTEYKAMPMGKLNELRAKLREVKSSYTITKNTLLSIALEQSGWPVPEELLKGTVAVTVSYGDLPATAKAVLDFARDNEQFITIKGGVMADTILKNSAQVQTLSELPPLDTLRAQLAGLIGQPATGIVSVLNAATSQIVNVLQAYVTENSPKDEGEAA